MGCDVINCIFVELTSGGIQSASASVAFEVLGLLMQCKNLEVVEITLAVVAPWSFQDLVERGTTSLLAHCYCGMEGGEFM